MLGTGWRLAVVIGLASLTWNAVSAMSLRKFSEIRFAQQSDALGAEQLADLQAFVCRVGHAPVEYVLAYSYAAGDEAQPQALAASRLQRVTAWLQENAPWDPRRTWAENKGTTKLPAYADPDEGLLPNRQVLLEAALGPPFRSQPLSSDCTPPWQTALLASANTAPTVARALVARGDFPADAPFKAALQARRLDIFEALHRQSGLRLDEPQRTAIALLAFRQDQVDYFLDWVRGEGRPVVARDAERFQQWLCNASVPQPDRLRAVDALKSIGAWPAHLAPASCTVP